MTTNTPYIRYNLTSKDIAIIRQHFCNDNCIDYLWRAHKQPNYKEALEKVDNWLDDMVALTLKQPSDKLMEKITACCADYPHCSHAQKIETKPKVAKNPNSTLTNNGDEPF